MWRILNLLYRKYCLARLQEMRRFEGRTYPRPKPVRGLNVRFAPSGSETR
jgi:hypothetical protein